MRFSTRFDFQITHLPGIPVRREKSERAAQLNLPFDTADINQLAMFSAGSVAPYRVTAQVNPVCHCPLLAATLVRSGKVSRLTSRWHGFVSQEGTADQMKPERTEETDQPTSESEHETLASTDGAYDTRAAAEAGAAAGKLRRPDSIRRRLAYLVVACVLPVWIVAGYLVYHNYQSRRALTEQHMLDTARALTMVVDQEIANIQASLRALAASPSLVTGDLRAFDRQALIILEAYPGARIFLADATGQELVNTYLPIGKPLPSAQLPGCSSPRVCHRKADRN